MSERTSKREPILTLTVQLPPDGTPEREAFYRQSVGEMLGIEPAKPPQVPGDVILRDEDGGATPAARTAPEPWTPKDGERVRVEMENGDTVACTVADERPDHGPSIWVRLSDGRLRLVNRRHIHPHADPGPDPRDAEIERLRTQVGEQSREIHGLKAELTAKPAAAPLSVEERERLGKINRDGIAAKWGSLQLWERMTDAEREAYNCGAEAVARAVLPDPARGAEAEAALKRQEWIEGMRTSVMRFSDSWFASPGVGHHPTFAAAIDAAMEKHPLKREGE